jgi:hypothetical protein
MRRALAALLLATGLAGACGDNDNDPQRDQTGDTVETPTSRDGGTPETTYSGEFDPSGETDN